MTREFTPEIDPRVDGAPQRTRIKICGVRTAEALIAAVDAGADLIGFVLTAGSPRTIACAEASALAADLPPGVTPVAVFRNDNRDLIDAWPFPWVQLHGDETHAEADLGRPVIKAMPFDREAIAAWDADPNVHALMVDSPEPGAGHTFDHAPLADARDVIRSPLFLAGGLTAQNVGAAVNEVRPYAVDVSSGVESSRGVKDPQRIHAFCRAVRIADQRHEA